MNSGNRFTVGSSAVFTAAVLLVSEASAIVRAASQASKAADWLLSFLPDAERLPDTDDMRSAA